MKITIDGRELLAKTPDNARLRDLIELQRQTGWKMQEIETQVGEADIFAVPLTAFLTLANAGFSPKWEDILDRPASDFQVVQEPGDVREGDAQDPPISPSDSDPGGEQHEQYPGTD